MTKLVDAVARISLSFALTAGLTLTALGQAHAADARPAPNDKKAELFDAGLRAAGAFGWTSAFIFMGVSGYYRPHPNFAVGAYFDGSITGSPGAEACYYDHDNGCALSAYRAGAAARWDVLPWFVVDPWVGVEVGPVWLNNFNIDNNDFLRVHAELEADLGIDVRVPYVSFGPYGLMSLALKDSPTLGRGGVGFRVAARF